MEPLLKRQRLYSPIRNQFLRTFSREQGYDIHERDELQDYDDLEQPRRGYESEEEDDEDDDDTIDSVPDPDSELQQKRMQLDFKLKSTFESIFEKYGKDFEGIGDEIDLGTGRIVVDNGHLSAMRHERDAGSRLYDESTEYTEESVESSLGGDDTLFEYDEDEEEEEEEEEVEEGVEEIEEYYIGDGEDDDMEDDMILRGFTKATQNIQPEPAHSRRPPNFVENTRTILEPRQIAPTTVQNSLRPSHSATLAEFGSQIHQYVSEQHSRRNIDVDPAWQAPKLSMIEVPRNQDTDNPWRIPPLPSPPRKHIERGLSWQTVPPNQNTNNLASAWKVPELPDRNWNSRNDIEPCWRIPELPVSVPRTRPDLNMNFKPAFKRQKSSPVAVSRPRPDENTSVKPAFKRRKSSPVVADSVWAEPEKERRNNPLAKNNRNPFTVEDDHVLLDCVKKARIRGIIMDGEFWKGMEAQYPRHPFRSWKQRYEKKYSYLEPDEIGEPESLRTTDSESFRVPSRLPSPPKKRTFLKKSPERPLPIPSRLIPEPVVNQPKSSAPIKPQYAEKPRQPTQQDSRVITWSRAIDATKTPVPEGHTEDLPDARQAIGSILGKRRYSQSEIKSSYTRHIDQRPCDSGQSMFSSHSNRVINDYQIPDQPQRQFIDLTETPSEKDDGLILPPMIHEKPPIGTAPCPHKDCKSYPSRFYQLDRTIEEDSSEMAVHLFEDHRTTAFPCGELNCPYVGENGYFTQFELVEHVKSAHPNSAALRRLEGRVSSTLLAGVKPVDAHIRSSWINPGDTEVATTHQESHYESPKMAQKSRVSSSSQLPSSGSDMDRTLTPRGTAGTSMYTPTTSVSSLIVNHPSAHSDPGEGLNQDRSSLPVVQTTENHHIEATPSTSKGFSSIREPTIVEDELPTRKFFKEQDQNIHLPDAQQSFSSTAGILGSDDADSVGTDRTHLAQYVQSPVVDQSSPLRPRTSLRSSIPDSQGSAAVVQLSREPVLPENATPQNNAKETTSLPRKSPSTVDTPAIPKVAPATRPQPPRAERSLPKQTFKTPARKGRNIHPGSAVEGDDELNLTADGFLLLASKSRSRPLPLETPEKVKREETADIIDVNPKSSVSAKRTKRKLNQILDDDDIDELTADSPMHCISSIGSSARKQVKVKTEEELRATGTQPSHQKHRIVKQPKPRKVVHQSRPAVPGLSGRKSQTPRSASRVGPVLGPARTITPLLDLTPAKKRGAHANQNFAAPDLAGASSSRADVPTTHNEGSSSPMEALITPSGKSYRQGSVEIKEEVTVPVVIVRTPLGTLKKCGENGFACKKSFCFRCGKSKLGGS
ncbi:hypothetical protein HYALB_00008081 [Hymenoscyphus albidus]|uniref:TERF2-interacting telomeric protein 1 Myb domain-containing protein n=1 Tax=Hymenoscyphus albidus TaxID=595503 RepID=A0A9N9LLP2_9HELO|nr:hypothetical protein HYALB_00008081 [Hymenoscyphus albidus]